jgi:hypothetical protein
MKIYCLDEFVTKRSIKELRVWIKTFFHETFGDELAGLIYDTCYFSVTHGFVVDIHYAVIPKTRQDFDAIALKWHEILKDKYPHRTQYYDDVRKEHSDAFYLNCADPYFAYLAVEVRKITQQAGLFIKEMDWKRYSKFDSGHDMKSREFMDLMTMNDFLDDIYYNKVYELEVISRNGVFKIKDCKVRGKSFLDKLEELNYA